MPGVPEPGSAAEAELIGKVVAERPWRGLWYGFFYFLRRWRTTGYMLIAGTKFQLPGWSFFPLVALGLWTDIRDRRTAPDLNVPQRTLATHILREESLRPEGRPSWRKYFTNRFILGFIAFLLVMPAAIYGSLRVASSCEVREQLLPAWCAGPHFFLTLVPVLCILAAYFSIDRFFRYWDAYSVAMSLDGSLNRKFWSAAHSVEWTNIPHMGYFGLYTKFILLVFWGFLMLLVIIFPAEILAVGSQHRPSGSMLYDVIRTFRRLLVVAHFFYLVPFMFSNSATWLGRGAAIAACFRKHLSANAAREVA